MAAKFDGLELRQGVRFELPGYCKLPIAAVVFGTEDAA